MMVYAGGGIVDILTLRSPCSIQGLQAVLRIWAKVVNKAISMDKKAGGKRI